jgi:hypothetical protein
MQVWQDGNVDGTWTAPYVFNMRSKAMAAWGLMRMLARCSESGVGLLKVWRQRASKVCEDGECVEDPAGVL